MRRIGASSVYRCATINWNQKYTWCAVSIGCYFGSVDGVSQTDNVFRSCTPGRYEHVHAKIRSSPFFSLLFNVYLYIHQTLMFQSYVLCESLSDGRKYIFFFFFLSIFLAFSGFI